jgi:hypothetical protein
LDGTGRSRLLESDQGPPRALGYGVDMGESLRVTIVYEPGEDGSREAEATHSA